jgi:plastocyanin
MRKLFVTLAAVALLVAFAAPAVAGHPPARAAAAKTRTVTIGDNYFSPKTLKVKRNTTVKWVWGPKGQGTEVEHNVTATRGQRFASKDLVRGAFKRTITRNTTIYCTLHATTMKMQIKVVG